LQLQLVEPFVLIEIWSDVVCPWCYIGKRRLETALSSFDHADDVEIVYRSFELDPTAPAVGHESIVEALGRKYGGGIANGRRLMAHVGEIAAQEGLDFDYEHATHTATIDAHRLLHFARAEAGASAQHALKEALLAAYFTRGESMGDKAVLRAVARSVGLDPVRIDAVLDSAEYSDQVEEDIATAHAYGVTGVPFYVIDQKYGISGAQPSEVFSQVLERAWVESRPQLTLIDAATGEACGPDGCEVQ
jgi:predicted DsbA family dithiol-disulfide isomerase